MTNQLLLGDCTELLREIPDDSVDLIVTDPPYNTGMKGGAKTGRLAHFFDDSLSSADYGNLVDTVSRELYRVLRNDRAAYIFMGWRSLGIWLDKLSRAGFRLKNVIVWDKVVHGLNYQNYAYTHEFLIFAVKGKFFPQNKGTGDDSYRDLWHLKRETAQPRSEAFHHETMKPAKLVRRPIEHASQPGDLVLDPFFGSGRILVEAKRLGRDYLGIERDVRYHDLAAAALRMTATELASSCEEGPKLRTHDRTPPRHRGRRVLGVRRRRARAGRRR